MHLALLSALAKDGKNTNTDSSQPLPPIWVTLEEQEWPREPFSSLQ